MAVTSTPIFVQGPNISVVLCATAVTSRSKTSTLTNFVQAIGTSTNGVRVDSIVARGAGSTALGRIFVWIFDGTDVYLYDELAINAATPDNTTTDSANVNKIYNTATIPPLVLPPTYKLYVTTTITQNVHVTTTYYTY